MRNTFKIALLASVVVLTSCGPNQDAASEMKEARSIERMGKWSNGYYDFAGDRVYAFAGHFKGRFDYDSCHAAATYLRTTYNRDRNTTAVMRSAGGVENFRLDANSRFAILGSRNETAKKTRWVCVNVVRAVDSNGASDGYGSFYYIRNQNNNQKRWTSTNKIVTWNVNGYTFRTAFGDDDRGGLNWGFAKL